MWPRLCAEPPECRDFDSALSAKCRWNDGNPACHSIGAYRSNAWLPNHSVNRFGSDIFRHHATFLYHPYCEQRPATHPLNSHLWWNQHLHFDDTFRSWHCFAGVLHAVRAEYAGSAECFDHYSHPLGSSTMNLLRNSRSRWLSFFLTVLTGSVAFSGSSTREVSALGRRLFSGEEELSGRMYTHTVAMPTAVIRCSNCHAAGNGPAVARSSAPRLTRDLLLQVRARRGGPPTSYGRDSFCRILRKGVDPAYILIDVAMPRYTFSDDQCMALWTFLTQSVE